MLFFFFKQKTAYEMRISDWSSDVCSSDLLDAGLVRQGAVLDADDEHVAELQALGRMQAHQPHLVAGVALVGMRQQRQRGGEVARAGVAAAVEPEIGRTSCRESVCQYG